MMPRRRLARRPGPAGAVRPLPGTAILMLMKEASKAMPSQMAAT
jgi:hypothetical protein